MSPLRGSCLCQAIAYEVEQLDMPISHCHCQTCRKAHAAAFASTAGVMREHFRWTRGEELLASSEELQKMWILRKILNPMDETECMEFLIDRLLMTKTNDEFFEAMKRQKS